jgi:hypothetical protein
MKKINKILIIILMIFATTSAFSQKVGYMGKRFVINADVNTSTAWFRQNYWGHKGFLHHNFIFAPSIEFIATNRIAIGVAYLNTEGRFHIQVEKNDTEGDRYDTEDNTFMAHGGGIYGKFYLGDGNAPMGMYIKGELDWFFYNYDIKPVPQAVDYVNGVQGKSNLGGLKVEFGRDFLFFNRLRITTAISFGIPFGGYKTAKIAWGSKFIPYITYNNKYAGSSLAASLMGAPEQSFVNTQIMSQYLIGVKIGIGLLAF